MYNKVIFIGNLTRDIEFQYLQGSNTPLAKGGIATSYKYKGNDGIQKEETCFLDFSIFGRTAEVANQYLHKGSKVILEGRLIFEQWKDQQSGQNRSKHTLRVDNMKMLDSSKVDNTNHQWQNNRSNQNGQKPKLTNEQEHVIDINEEDIPF